MPRWVLVALLLLALPSVALAADRSLLSAQQVNTVKALLAGAGTLLLVVRLALPRWRQLPARRRRLWDGALLGLGLLAAACWWNLFQFNYPIFGHPSETYHYYVGSKYFRELGYTRLYRCTAVADAEAGWRKRVENRYVRDLETNDIVLAAALLEHPEDCKQHFTKERWRDFSRDVAWFRTHLPQRRWHMTQTDHGYNGTPAWGLFGGLLAHTGRATDAQILALRLIDPLLLLLTWAAVGWTFGWRVLCVALLYWGSNYPAQYGWVGGSYLRQVEFAAVLLGICLMRRQRMTAAGFLLVLAALVRVYPALLLAGPGLQAAGAMLRQRRLWLSAAHRRLLLGGLLALATVLPLSALDSGGFGAWLQFAENSRVLLDTPLRNHVGLRTVLSYDHEASSRFTRDTRLADPYARWKRAREEAFASHRLLFGALVAGFVLLLAAAVRGQPEWVAVVLGAGLVPVAAELTCYYSAILVVFALLWRRHPPAAAALVGLSAAGWLITERFLFYDEIFTWISLATLAFVLFATLWVWRAAPTEPESLTTK
ncbi:MAG: hypothetical protein JRS35_04585 [Deltaproteobacteria bacterium]|nr:hypothetical protein [Deltaproteobacteria bacterium]